MSDAINKRYIAVWYNSKINKTCIERILAEDITEAKLIMVYLMKYYGGLEYETKDILSLEEETDNYYVDYKSIVNRFRSANMKLPSVNPIY